MALGYIRPPYLAPGNFSFVDQTTSTTRQQLRPSAE
jgi:hypothetical protein